MKTIRIHLLIIVTTLIAVSCGSKNSKLDQLLGTWQVEQVLDDKGNIILDASKKDSLIAQGLAEDRNYYQMNEIEFTPEDSLKSVQESENLLKILFETKYEFGKNGIFKLHSWNERGNMTAVSLEGTYKFDEKTSSIERSVTKGDQKQDDKLPVEWLSDGRMKMAIDNNSQYLVLKKVQ
ncbi:MAG: hypothetical protein N2167_01860 [Flavobacteriales bacterium]|nr:hypothetical protein [Flavobacteriales bacterium]